MRPNRLKHYLKSYDKSLTDTLVTGFSSGFHLGISGDPPIAEPRNHISALNNSSKVSEKLSKELALGRISGPFTQPPFSNLSVSPLGLVPKKDPGKFRLIHNLSYPKGQSINDLIPKEISAVQYETIENAISLVKQFGRHCLMAKADIEDAFRLIPIHPSNFRFLGFKWDNLYYYDKCLPMGCSSSCKLFETFSCSIQWIMTHSFHANMSHLLDDFFFVGPPNSNKCKHDLMTFFQVANDIGIPIKSEKTHWPSTVIVIYGIQLNTDTMTASLPLDKINKARSLLLQFSNKRRIMLKDLQSIIGLLNFFCVVIIPGRAFLRRLIDLTLGVAEQHHHIRLNTEARADIQAWLYFLSEHNGKSCFLFDNWVSSETIKLFSDAAGVHGGCAAVLGHLWFVGEWTEQLQSYHITLKELLPIVIAMEIWGQKLSNHKILFMCDNSAVVDIINKTSSKDSGIMKLVRRLVLATLKYNIFFKAKHIPGFTNVVADRLSRFQFQAAFQVAPWLSPKPVEIPPQLMTV